MNSGAVHEFRSNAPAMAVRTAGPASAGTRASTEPPKPPPIIRAPSAPAATAASTVTSACGQEIMKSSRSDRWASQSKAPIFR